MKVQTFILGGLVSLNAILLAAILLVQASEQASVQAAEHASAAPTANSVVSAGTSSTSSSHVMATRVRMQATVHVPGFNDATQMAATPGRELDVDDTRPIRVRIPDLGVDADVGVLGLTEAGRLEVPTDFSQTGWYDGRSIPGETGPSIIVGHVDSFEGPAVFFHLRELEVGDMIHIDRADDLTVQFRVSSTTEPAKKNFPTEAVYGDTEDPTLRLVTCGGDFDRVNGSYLSNFIVFAEYVDTYPTA